MINENFDYENSGFGIEATFNIGGSDLNVWGIFTDASESENLLTQEIERNDPSFWCNTGEIDAVKNDMSVEIGGTVYKVKRKQKLGTGDTLFYLKT